MGGGHQDQPHCTNQLARSALCERHRDRLRTGHHIVIVQRSAKVCVRGKFSVAYGEIGVHRVVSQAVLARAALDFGNPIPAHYVARAEKLPILTMVFNNEMWGAVKRNTREVYPTGYAAKSNREPLTYFDPALKFEKAVEVAGGYGEQVSNPADMPKAVERALKVVKEEKRQALVNVCLEASYVKTS